MVSSTGGDAFYHHHHRPLEQQFNQCSFHHSNSQYNHHDNGFCNYDQNSNQYHHMNGDLNNSYRGWEPWSNNGDSGYGSNHSTPHSGRKRGWLHSDRPTSPGPDQQDGITHAKLYVAPVPKTATESDIRTVFEGHGVIVEVVLLKDKRTGHRQGSCFVKYETLDEADRAIRALNNQYTFAGESSPIVVRFADGELERLGVADKVFVSSLSSYVSRKDIEEVFSLYGQVEYIYLARERGYAFVKFSSREMASASIKGLNGVFTMKGCHRPLIVRFADPKKPKAGEQRSNYLSGSAQFGPCSQEPVVRPPLNYGDPNGVSIMPMAPHYSTSPHPQLASHMQNWEPGGTVVQQKFPTQQAPLQFAPMPLQPVQAPKLSPQPVITEVQTQWHSTDSSAQNIEQQISSQTGNSVLTIASSASPDMMGSLQVETYPECDWSEHTSTDGDKYYFNCVTSESRWDKPEEYALYENGVQKQHEQEDHSCHHSQSSLPSQVAQRQQETNHVQGQSQTSPVVSQV